MPGVCLLEGWGRTQRATPLPDSSLADALVSRPPLTLLFLLFLRAGTAMSAMLLWSSLWSLLFSAVSTVTTSELAGARSFLSRHPEAWSPLCLVSICSSLGTFFVLYTIQRFGPPPPPRTLGEAEERASSLDPS